jgi:hypothetical protein
MIAASSMLALGRLFTLVKGDSETEGALVVDTGYLAGTFFVNR